MVSFSLSYFPDSAVHIVSTADPVWTANRSKQDVKHWGLHLAAFAGGDIWLGSGNTNQLAFHLATDSGLCSQ